MYSRAKITEISRYVAHAVISVQIVVTESNNSNEYCRYTEQWKRNDRPPCDTGQMGKDFYQIGLFARPGILKLPLVW
jgi:hypothetical protein